MRNDLKLDVDQAGELKMSFRRNGWNNHFIKKLSEGNVLQSFLFVLMGKAEIKLIESKIEGAPHLIDCDAEPNLPGHCLGYENKKGGI